ncbi:hypothetical protein ABGB12_05980 [Actinocorallia sp. B10E7]|uniref:hypothetical protein n=1 Tax=Actinocorallia sp. B10E7 TaxID=3153558 RepID=UPI00325C43E5
MAGEIQLISDDDGLAVIGDPTTVEEFLTSEGLWSSSKDLGQRLKSLLGTGALMAQAGSEIAAGSGRWLKLTEESAQRVREYGLRTSSTTGLSTGVLKGDWGQIGGFVEFVKGPGTLLNPTALSSVAGLMQQASKQQSMAEITAYLARIDKKIDDVLRVQRDQVLARLDGADLMLEDAMTVRDHQTGRVDEVTWSTVQDAPGRIGDTQAYALRQLDDLAKKVERKSKIGDLAKAAREVESEVQVWLFVLARCFSLQDAFDVLRLDRVLDTSPDDLDGHRLGLRAARQKRLDAISQATEQLTARMEAAAHRANTRLLWHPTASPAVMNSRNNVATGVHDLHGLLGIDSGRRSWKTRRWVDAAAEARDKVLETGAEGVDTAIQLGNETFDRARSVTAKLSSRIAERAARRRADDEEPDEKS